MKRALILLVIVTLLVATTVPAMAGGHGGGHHNNNGWVAAGAVMLGVGLAAAIISPPVVYQQPGYGYGYVPQVCFEQVYQPGPVIRDYYGNLVQLPGQMVRIERPCY